MESGELATRWTVRVAMLLYALTLATQGRADDRLRRWLWTLGCAAYVAHVAWAFHVYHDWSHDAAYAHTAQRTLEQVGFDWGGGIYANHVFTLVWLGDAAWWWVGIEAYRQRPRGVTWLVQGYLAFVAFNAVVVFAGGATRWAGVVATATLAWLRLRSV